MQSPLKYIFLILCAATLLAAAPAFASDTRLSGFGTIGYAKSDQSFNYQRFINRSGTLKRDTVFGIQADTRFNPKWSATIQAKLAPALNSDNRWQPTLSWAFLSYRPNNEWLMRAGKLRAPFYLQAENMDVGTTYSPARLPNELYSVSPTMDFNGASFVGTWMLDNSELSLDGYWGRAQTPWRTYHRDTSESYWLLLNIEARGLSLNWDHEENIFRAGIHTADLTRDDGLTFPVTMSQITSPGINGTYYPEQPYGEQRSKITSPTFNFGVDLGWKHDFRTRGEYVRRTIKGMDSGPDTESYYLSLLKKAGKWTPYLTYARIMSNNLSVYQSVNNSQVSSAGAPPFVIDAINAGQRMAADSLSMYDQFSWAIGTSYAIDINSKIKAEWMIVNTGEVSSFVDAPAGEESGHRRINVFSLSYNFVF